MRPYHLVLSPDERMTLEQARNHDARPYLREMCAAILKVADGMPARQVALHGLGRRRKPETVFRWLATYRAGGIEALVHRPRGHRGFSPCARRPPDRDGAPGAALSRNRPQPLALCRSAGGA